MFIAKYFNKDGTLLRSYRRGAPTELQTGRSYGATDGALLTELQTGRSYGATDGALLQSYYCKSSGGALPSVEMMAMKKIRLRRSRPL
jgi:hypothetical protein